MTPRTDAALLDKVQCHAFRYFLHEANEGNGLIRDRTSPGWPASIAAVGLALAAYPVAVERGLMPRAVAAARTLAALRFFWTSRQGPEPDATGHRGFYYHFLDMESGARVWHCELSTVDSAFLVAGMLAAAAYFGGSAAAETELRDLAERLYARMDWRWAMDGGLTLTHGWKPESGFLRYRWQGYDESLLMQLLGLGSPTHPLPPESYAAWTSTFKWKTIYGHSYLYSGPLFIHQLPQAWLDCRGIRDPYMRGRGLDYFENSRRATLVQQAYGVRNPRGFAGYDATTWGISASDGPGPSVREIGGVRRRFYDYLGRGVPFGCDDGTVAPWAVVASLPFAPEIVIPTVRRFTRHRRLGSHQYGFHATFNPTFPDPEGSPVGWVSSRHYGINQGPIVLMVENYRTGLVWELMRGSEYLRTGLRAAGFTGGWLSSEKGNGHES